MARPINVRDEAEQVLAQMQGRLTYKASVPCKWGHELKRYVSTGRCVECTIDDTRKYRGPMVQREMKAERFANGEFYVKL